MRLNEIVFFSIQLLCDSFPIVTTGVMGRIVSVHVCGRSPGDVERDRTKKVTFSFVLRRCAIVTAEGFSKTLGLLFSN